MDTSGILREGQNCWRICQSQRAAFLVDGEAYFAAVAAAVLRAQQTVYIVGWDIDSRIHLVRGDTAGIPADLPAALGPFLNALVTRRPELNIYVLNWDFVMLYALEREPLPVITFGWSTHDRLHFKLDNQHPLGASQHQKLVVIDDQVAFCGGFDLASNRWDTNAHAPADPRRLDHGVSYGPFHDVQLLVDGEAAQALGELVRERWLRAAGESIDPPQATASDPWPPTVAADLERVAVGILRTYPAGDGREPIGEVKAFHLDALAAAKTYIYIENQYFTAHAVGEVLARKLAEESGPEVVLVLPHACSGWLEESTMGVLRARLLARLQQADRHGRLKVYFPVNDRLGEEEINVHAKVLVMDDSLVRVGSSNLNNRSMGLDSECDLVIEAGGEARLEQGIAGFRNRLLAEHLGTSPAAVATALARHHGSLIAAIESLNGRQRRLEPLVVQVDPWLDELVPDSEVIDPEKPTSFNDLVEQLNPLDYPSDDGGGRRRGRLLLLLLGISLLLAAVWRWTPMSSWLDLESLAAWGTVFRDSPLAPLIILAVYVVGGFLLVPVTLLILATAIVFGPVTGFVYALGGVLASAFSGYVLGRVLGRARVRSMTGDRVHRIRKYLTKQGLVTVTAVRLIPLAPFTVVNLVAGASQIRPRHFLFGTILGMIPGILAITLFQEGLVNALRSPDWSTLLLLVAVVVATLVGSWLLRHWLRRKGLVEGGGRHGR